MEGRRAETIEAARKSRAIISDDLLAAMPGIDWYVGHLYAAMTRFGQWDEILAEPAPNTNLTGLTAAFLYAKVVALAAKSRIDDAKTQLTDLEKLAAAIGPDDGAGLNRLQDVLAVAALNGRARIVLAEGKENDAITLLREAVAKEDQLAYDEPADWFFPTRHLLGAVLIKAGKAADAEVVYWDDLSRHPNNGWALFGLTQSLKLQGRSAEAAAAQQRFDTAWKNADATPVASAY
jgi:tetratricopeptide (TPR) repeat protein